MVRIESDRESLAALWNRDGDIQDLSDELSMAHFETHQGTRLSRGEQMFEGGGL